MTRYIIMGAAGHLGSTAIRLLLAGGQKVRSLILPIELPAVEGGNMCRETFLTLKAWPNCSYGRRVNGW